MEIEHYNVTINLTWQTSIEAETESEAEQKAWEAFVGNGLNKNDFEITAY